LSGKDPATQAYLRQLAALSALPASRQTLSPFPLSLLERGLRAALEGLEAVIRRAVMAIGHK
jgi:hypothetical protein